MLAPWLASQSPLLRRKRTSLAARSTSETCVVSPVNASRRPSRDAAHHSGSGRMASPYPMGDFHLLFFASFPGALRVGSKCERFTAGKSCPLFPKSPTLLGLGASDVPTVEVGEHKDICRRSQTTDRTQGRNLSRCEKSGYCPSLRTDTTRSAMERPSSNSYWVFINSKSTPSTGMTL